MEWFVLGLLVGVGGYALVEWLRRGTVRVAWYEWLIGAVGLLLALTALQNFFASRAELESRAAWMGLLFLGLPAVVLGAAASGLVWRRSLARSQAKS